MSLNIFGKIFGSSDAIKTAGKAIDALHFSPEEKAQAKVNLLNAYEAFKIAQRLLSLIVGIPFVSIFTLCALIVLLTGIFGDGSAAKVAKEVMQLNIDTLGNAFSIILAFYFLGGALEGTAKAVKKN